MTMRRRGRAAIAVAAVMCAMLAPLTDLRADPPAAAAQAAADADVDLQVVASMTQAPGNIAVSPDGRMFVSLHQFYGPDVRVVEVMGDGTTRPFPNAAWSDILSADGVGLQAVLGIRASADGVLWMLDNGSSPPRLIGWNLNDDSVHQIIAIRPPASVPGSFLNDFAIDLANNAIYIADFADTPEKAAIVVVDLASGKSRRVLQGDRSTRPEDVPLIVDGRRIRLHKADGLETEARVGVNPITIDVEYQWVYYGAMNGTALWRVRTADLVNSSLSAADLSVRVERFGDKPLSDGISIDSDGGVYVTDLAANGIGVVDTEGHYRLLVQDPQKLSWPDGMSGGPNGRMYVTVNQLHRSPPLNGGVNNAQPPFYIVSFQPLAPAVVGR
jgi:sugar lactone lactonase YvrE